MIDDWRAAGLITASVLKPVFSTIEQGLVMRVMGHFSAAGERLARHAGASGGAGAVRPIGGDAPCLVVSQMTAGHRAVAEFLGSRK